MKKTKPTPREEFDNIVGELMCNVTSLSGWNNKAEELWKFIQRREKQAVKKVLERIKSKHHTKSSTMSLVGLWEEILEEIKKVEK